MSKFLDEFEEVWVDDSSNINIGDNIIFYGVNGIIPSSPFYTFHMTIGKEYEVIDKTCRNLLKVVVINDKGNKEWFSIDWFNIIF